MIFVSTGRRLYRVLAVRRQQTLPYFALVDKDGGIYEDYSRTEWKFHTKHVAAFLTLVFGNDYPYPVLGRAMRYADWMWADNEIMRAISRNSVSRTEAQRASRRASDFC